MFIHHPVSIVALSRILMKHLSGAEAVTGLGTVRENESIPTNVMVLMLCRI
jgi:hypothetical protein